MGFDELASSSIISATFDLWILPQRPVPVQGVGIENSVLDERDIKILP